MPTQRFITMKPAFLGGIRALPAKEMQQVMSKIELLCQDLLPNPLRGFLGGSERSSRKHNQKLLSAIARRAIVGKSRSISRT